MLTSNENAAAFLMAVRNDAQYGPRPLHNRTFNFQALPYSVQRRFVELLTPQANYFFEATNKYYYSICFDIRGLQVGHLKIGTPLPIFGGIQAPDQLTWLRNAQNIPPHLLKYVSVQDTLSINYSAELNYPFDFIKNYWHLSYDVYNYEPHLKEQMLAGLRTLIHPNLRRFSCYLNHVTLDLLTDILNELSECEIDFYGLLSGNNTTPFAGYKNCIEKFYRRHGNSTQVFKLGFNAMVFKVVDNKLCYRFPHSGFYVKHYNFYDLLF